VRQPLPPARPHRPRPAVHRDSAARNRFESHCGLTPALPPDWRYAVLDQQRCGL